MKLLIFIIEVFAYTVVAFAYKEKFQFIDNLLFQFIEFFFMK